MPTLSFKKKSPSPLIRIKLDEPFPVQIAVSRSTDAKSHIQPQFEDDLLFNQMCFQNDIIKQQQQIQNYQTYQYSGRTLNFRQPEQDNFKSNLLSKFQRTLNVKDPNVRYNKLLFDQTIRLSLSR